MPREKITGNDRDGYDVQVGWHNDGADVQLGIETADGRSLLTMLYGSDPQLERIAREVAEIGRKPLTAADARAFGREILDVIEGGPAGTPPEASAPWSYYSVWARLDRHGVNRLVRMLRRARDAAFGADE
jgi:hypothetical protein